MRMRTMMILMAMAAAAAVPTFAGEVKISKPKSIDRDGGKWSDGGRVVGELVDFDGKVVVDIKKARGGALVGTVETVPGVSVYFTPVLPPGKYELIFKADGFADARAGEVPVRQGADTVLNLKFEE